MKVWELQRQDQVRTRKKDLDELMERVRTIALSNGVRVVPFGSYSDAAVDTESDLDIAFPGPLSRETQLRLIHELEKLEAESGIRIDMVFEAETPSFFREVMG